MLRKLQLPWCTLALAAAALVAAAVPGAFDLLVLDRAAVMQGEFRRLLTGHLVHATGYHLTWDCAALLLLGFRFERILGRRFPLVVAGSMLAVTLGVLVLDPALDRYCGLSGILNGIWVAGALAFAGREQRDGRRALAWVYRGAVAAGLLKIGVEGILGAPLFTDAAKLGAAPVPLAHALGALAGVLVWIHGYQFRVSETIISPEAEPCPSKPASLSSPTSTATSGPWRGSFTTSNTGDCGIS
jgi:rhomboid family GlyGly-CTERM serine protease